MELGCSSFTWTAKDGCHFLGRTYDYIGDLRNNQILAFPQGHPCRAGLQADGVKVPGRYGYTGMAVLGFGEPILVDGVNSAGLMGALLHYPEYAFCHEKAEPGKNPVHPGRLLPWLLSQCAELEEAVKSLSALTLVDDMAQGSPLSAHYLLTDTTGEAVVVEPDREGLHIYRNTIGVLANSPSYPWHLTHLRTFAGVTNQPLPMQNIGMHQLRPFGEGQGSCFGLPGDFSSPSRFVRLAFTKAFALPGEDEADGVSRMFRAFSTVYLPEGVAKREPEGYMQTLCISVMCGESGTYYFSPSGNRRISAVRPLGPDQEPGVRYFVLGEKEDVLYRN